MPQTNTNRLYELANKVEVACAFALFAGVALVTFPGCSGGSNEPRGPSSKSDSQQLSSEPPRGGSPETGTPPAQDGPDAYCERASAYQRDGDYERATSVLSAAIQLYPDYSPAYGMRGDVYRIMRDWARAIEDYTQFIRMNPDHGVAYERRGLVYREQKDLASALRDFGQALRCDPANADALQMRARCYGDLGQLDKALADLDAAIRIEPDSSVFHGDRGLVYYRMGDYEQALACFTEAIRLEPRNPDFFGKRGSLFRKLGDDVRATADLAMEARLEEQLANLGGADGGGRQDQQSQDRPTRRPSQPTSAGGWSDPNAPTAWNDPAEAEAFIRESQASRSGAVNATRGKQQREESHATDAEKRLAKRMADLEQRRSEREQKILGMADSLSEDQIAQLRSQALAEYQTEKQVIIREFQADNLRAQGASAEVIRSVLEGR